MIALVMYLLLAAMLEYGRAIYVAQSLQSVADLAARELAHTPLAPTLTLPEALSELRSDSNNRLYSEDYLVIELTNRSFEEVLADPNLPLVNQQLVPLMFKEQIGGVEYLRYPGALVTSTTAASGYTVKIPYLSVVGDVETIDWHDVVEPISKETDSFSVTSQDRGVVALRINYPFQAASLSSYPPANGEFPRPQIANDEAIAIGDDAALNGGQAVAADLAEPDRNGPRYGSAASGTAYAGKYGLGVHGAMARPARPFRKIISAQAIFRREVFSTSVN